MTEKRFAKKIEVYPWKRKISKICQFVWTNDDAVTLQTLLLQTQSCIMLTVFVRTEGTWEAISSNIDPKVTPEISGLTDKEWRGYIKKLSFDVNVVKKLSVLLWKKYLSADSNWLKIQFCQHVSYGRRRSDNKLLQLLFSRYAKDISPSPNTNLLLIFGSKFYQLLAFNLLLSSPPPKKVLHIIFALDHF